MNYRISEVVGHEKEINFLNGIFRNNRIPHGIIFYGQQNIGKRFTATAFAASVLCKDYKRYQNSGDINKDDIEWRVGSDADYPCGKCVSCAGVAGGNNPNLFIVEPDGNSIKLEKIHMIESFLSLKPSFDSHRFIIIDNAGSMNRSAMNALLKILEEPPDGVCFILIAANLSSLLPTIVSRCLLLGFTGVSAEALIKNYETKMSGSLIRGRDNDSFIEDIDDKRLTNNDIIRVYAKIANGSYSNFQSLLNGSYFEIRNLILENIFNQKKIGYYDLSDTFSASLKKNKDESRTDFFEIFLIILRDMFIYHMTKEVDLVYNNDICEKFEKFITHSGATPDGLLEMIDLTVAYMDKADYNLNKTIAMDAYFADIANAISDY